MGGLPTHNIWSYPSVGSKETPDLTAVWGSIVRPGGAEVPSFLSSDDDAAQVVLPCFMSFPSAKDADYESKCPGKSVAVVLTEARVEYFGDAGEHGKRGEKYEEIKQRYKTALLNAFYRHFPHLKTKV